MKCPSCNQPCIYSAGLWYCQSCDKSYLPTFKKPAKKTSPKKVIDRFIRRLKQGGLSDEKIKKILEKEDV